MAEIDPKDSVHDEQFGNSEDKNENVNNPSSDAKPDDTSQVEHSDNTEKKPIEVTEQENNELPASNSGSETNGDDGIPGSVENKNEAKTTGQNTEEPTDNLKSSAQPQTEALTENNAGQENKAVGETNIPNNESTENQPAPTTSDIKETSTPDGGTPPSDGNKEASEDKKNPSAEGQNKEEQEAKEEPKLPKLSEIDYSQFSNDKLVDLISQYIADFDVDSIKDHIEVIKSVFYKQLNEQVEEKKSKFLADGGVIEDFKVEESPVELKMKDLINYYKEKRNERAQDVEATKEANLKTKMDIIDSIKELINSKESLNKTFQDFRNLQEKWREVGAVPQKSVKDLWESYHYHVEAFYDFIKINKELRDLDFKKNLDAKILLCEKAEELLLEPSVVEAFRNLQALHDQWREIGPVPADKRSEIWERFREATSKINHRHQEYFVNLKEEQKNNLKEKTVLCEKAEELAVNLPDNAKEWETKSKEIIELQKIWKTIGFAPKKYNTKIYERFRAACDIFFDKKREYFAQNREEQENNLQLKTELCIQAEAVKDSTDWKKTTDELIKLQKKWKTIGPVPIKVSDKIWKRFRAACDTFFNSKSKYFENIDSKYEDNLKLKEALIEEINNFELNDNVEENLNQLKDIQRRWSEIGFVPIKQKDSIQEKYREAINAKFDSLRLDEDKKSLLKFRSRVEGMVSKPNADRRIYSEREKCYTKIKQLENDITLWENNIGFFSNSKNAESMIQDVKHKIKNAQERLKTLKEKLNILNEMD